MNSVMKKCKITGCTNTSLESYDKYSKGMKYAEYCRKHYDLARKPLMVEGDFEADE